jgi:hypothetical protein
MIDHCLALFFRHVYPTMPILHKGRLLESVTCEIDQSTELYCLVLSLCAFMVIQPGMPVVGSPVRFSFDSERVLPYRTAAAATIFLDEILRLRTSTEHVEHPTVHAIQTSFFLFACYFGLEKHHRAWYHLREATTLAQMIGMQDDRSYLAGSSIDNILKRRLYWLLFVTERAYALQRHRPLTLHATIALPTLQEVGEESLVIEGFLQMINLFRPFDDTFVGLWNQARNDCSTAWLAQLQQRLSNAVPLRLSCTETQAADIVTTQQWLRTIIWQLSITNGYLSSTSSNASMTFRYPIDIAKDMMINVRELPLHALEVHGIGLIEKLFDVACTVADVIACVPLDRKTIEVGPADYLQQCLSLISTLRGGSSRFPSLLLAKVSENLPFMSISISKSPAWIKQEEVDEVGSPSSTSSIHTLPPSPCVMSTGSFSYSHPSLSEPSPGNSDTSMRLATPRSSAPITPVFPAAKSDAYSL